VRFNVCGEKFCRGEQGTGSALPDEPCNRNVTTVKAGRKNSAVLVTEI
jgi:hypothetical protein